MMAGYTPKGWRGNGSITVALVPRVCRSFSCFRWSDGDPLVAQEQDPRVWKGNTGLKDTWDWPRYNGLGLRLGSRRHACSGTTDPSDVRYGSGTLCWAIVAIAGCFGTVTPNIHPPLLTLRLFEWRLLAYTCLVVLLRTDFTHTPCHHPFASASSRLQRIHIAQIQGRPS